MSTYDEKRRTSRGRKPKRYVPGSRPDPRKVQLALKLMGGTTAKDKGAPFDDEIPF